MANSQEITPGAAPVKVYLIGIATFSYLALSCLLSNSIVFSQDEPAAVLIRVQRQYLDAIKPLLKQNCGECHWGDDHEGDLNLEPFNSLDEILAASEKWNKIIGQVETGNMPPPGEAKPFKPAEKIQLLKWLDELVNTVDCSEINPGKATLRRLNRTEYRNTIRDLTGVDFEPARSFPGDDVGYGFDNIGDVLSLPPILMEKYLSAAEKILAEAIPESKQAPFTFYSKGSALKLMQPKASSSSNERGSVNMYSNSTVYRDIEFPKSTSYRVIVHAYGTQAGDEPVKAAILLDGKEKKRITVKASKPNEKVYEITIRSKKGRHRIGIQFLNDYYKKSGPDRGDRNLIIQDLWVVSSSNARDPLSKIIFERPGWLPNEQQAVARKIVQRFTSFAFRRVATKSEIDRLLVLFNQARVAGDSFDASIRFTLQAVLVSPHFLFKVEQPVDSDSRDLNQYELATSLSYFLWSSMPDAELFSLATNGKMNKPDVLAAQTRRMLADPRARALVENFAAQWLQLRSLRDFQPDPVLFPTVDKKLLSDMVWETKMTVADVFLNNRSVIDLLGTQSTFLNEALAKHYQVPNVNGNEFRKVNLDGIRPGGVLSHGSILTLTSNPTRTSPVKRGKWIMENLLANEPPPPDPNVMQLDDQTELTGTLRERMEQHRADPNCASCHKTMDQLGFALENFDAVGRWREQDEGAPIDSSAKLEDGTPFSGAEGLQLILQTDMKDQFIRCFTEKLLIYSLGRGLQYYDQCSVDNIIDAASADNFKFYSLVIGVVESEPFLRRQGNRKPTNPTEPK